MPDEFHQLLCGSRDPPLFRRRTRALFRVADPVPGGDSLHSTPLRAGRRYAARQRRADEFYRDALFRLPRRDSRSVAFHLRAGERRRLYAGRRAAASAEHSEPAHPFPEVFRKRRSCRRADSLTTGIKVILPLLSLRLPD